MKRLIIINITFFLAIVSSGSAYAQRTYPDQVTCYGWDSKRQDGTQRNVKSTPITVHNEKEYEDLWNRWSSVIERIGGIANVCLTSSSEANMPETKERVATNTIIPWSGSKKETQQINASVPTNPEKTKCVPRISVASGNRQRCVQAGEREFGYCEIIYHKPKDVPNEYYYSVIFIVEWPGSVNGNKTMDVNMRSSFRQRIENAYGPNLPLSQFCEYAVSGNKAQELREGRKVAMQSRVIERRFIQTDIQP